MHRVIVSDILLKSRSFELYFCRRKFRYRPLSSTTFTQFAPTATEFAEITQNNGHYAVQGNSRSPISVLIESSYATSY